jgi:hypothetical protein
MAHRIRMAQWLVTGGLLLAASSASAQEGALFKNLFEGTFGGKGDNDIEYRQRPPLVVPPASTLPRPQDEPASRSAAWPNDPDVAGRRAAKRNAQLPATEREKYKENQRPLLSQEEIRRGRLPGQAVGNQEFISSRTYDENIGPIVIGRQMAAKRDADSLAKLQYGTEPERKFLYEPPAGYRKPAGSAPIGLGQVDTSREDQQALGQLEFATGQQGPRVGH